MKEILNCARLDYLTAKPTAVPIWTAITLMTAVLSLFIAPMISAYGLFSALMILTIPGGTEEKCGFHKLYGILPVQRKNITRGRFCFMYVMLFMSQIITLSITWIAIELQLWRILPSQGGELMQFVEEAFKHEGFINYGASVGIFTVLCIMFCYMEMMGQIFGRENEMKIICITLAVITVIGVGLGWLSNHNILPVISADSLFPKTLSGKIIACIIANLAALALTILFAEITAAKVSKREL